MISSELLQAMATADGNERGVLRKKNYSQTHTPQETNKQQTNKKTKKQPQKNIYIDLTNMQLYTCSTIFLFFFLYITLQFVVTALQVDDVKLPLFNS